MQDRDSSTPASSVNASTLPQSWQRWHFWLCEGVRSPGTRVTDRCEQLCGCWELIPHPLEEQPMLLTTEASLQPLSTKISGITLCSALRLENSWDYGCLSEMWDALRIWTKLFLFLPLFCSVFCALPPLLSPPPPSKCFQNPSLGTRWFCAFFFSEIQM